MQKPTLPDTRGAAPGTSSNDAAAARSVGSARRCPPIASDATAASRRPGPTSESAASRPRLRCPAVLREAISGRPDDAPDPAETVKQKYDAQAAHYYALATPESGDIDSQTDRFVAGDLRALDHAFGYVAVGMHVKLEPLRAIGSLGDFLDGRTGHRA